METKKTFCRYCHGNCALRVDVEDNRVVAVRGDATDPVYGGYTCVKGRQLPAYTHHEERLLSALKKTANGGFQRISSEQAFDEISAKIHTIVNRHGPGAIASYNGSHAFQNSTAMPLAKAFHSGLGSPCFFTSATIDQPAKAFTWSRFGLWGGGLHTFRDADVIMVVGNNCPVSHFAPPGGLPPFNPYRRLRDAKARGLKLICVDPRCTEMTSFADIHLQVRPGEDPTLLAGMLHIILDEEMEDKAFCARHVRNLEALKACVADFTPAYVERRCEVPEEKVYGAARMFAKGPRGAVTSSTGPELAPRGTLTEHFVMTLNAVCGRFYREGEVSTIPKVLRPPTPRKAQVHIRRPLWGEGFHKCRVRGLTQLGAEMPTTAAADEMLLPGDGQIRALLCIGGNPIVAWPDQVKTFRALSGLELLVSLDVIVSATGKLAHYIVPSQVCTEREDVTSVSEWWHEEPYARYTAAMIEPAADVVNMWEFFWELARRLNVPLDLPGGRLGFDAKPTTYEVLKKIFAGSRVPLEEIRQKTRDGGKIFHGVEATVEPADPERRDRFELAPEGVLEEIRALREESLHEKGLVTSGGRTYTHLLTSRRTDHFYNSSSHYVEGLQPHGVTNYAHVNPADLKSLHIESDSLVLIEAENASIVGVALGDEKIRPGVISMAHCFGDMDSNEENVRMQGSSTNKIVATDKYFDPITGMTRLSAIPVNIMPFRGSEQ